MKLTDCIREFVGHLPQAQALYVGFSGGADSTALLLSLHLAGAVVRAVHFNHGIRGAEADGDEQWCRDFCGRRGIPLEVLHLRVPENTRRGESCEEAGRRLRLEQWQRLASGGMVALAHHADDALEDIFLRLARGANVSSLVPMKAEREMYGVRFVRPMLDIRRREIETWLLDHGVNDWRVDSTNADNAMRRNAVRNRLLPLFREIFGTDEGLVKALAALRKDAEFFDNALPQELQGILPWRSLPPALLPRALHRLLPGNIMLTASAVLRVQEALRNFSGREIAVPLEAGQSLLVGKAGVTLAGENILSELRWNWRLENRIEIPLFCGGGVEKCCLELRAGQGAVQSGDDGLVERFSHLPQVLIIRSWRNGDTMRPFGSANRKKLQDLFSDAKIPRYQRHSYPVIQAEGEIIWVPGLRRAEYGRVTPGEDCLTILCHRS